MKSLLFVLALGLASSDILDRSYLPPPGSKFSGGSPGSIEVPLEFPKETYSTTLRPLTPGQKDNGIISSEDSQLTVGIDRGTGLQNRPIGTSQNLGPVTPGPNAPFTYFQNSYKVPTTTTSYAFTQTTTFPPSEGFETTISPIDATGFPTDGSLSNLQQQISGSYPQIQGQTFTQNGQVFPGYPQPHTQITGQQPGFVSGINSDGQQTGFGFQPQIPGSQNVINGQSDLNQFQQGLRPGSTISPIPDGPVQSPGFVQSPFESQGLTQHLGVQPPRQFIGQPGIPSTAAPQLIPNYQPGSQQFSLPSTAAPQNIPSNQQISTQFGGYPNNIQGATGLNIPQQHGGQLSTQFPGQEGSFPSQGSQGIPSYQLNSNQYGYTNIPQQFNGQQSTFPSTSAQSISVSQPGSTQFGQILDSLPGTFAPDSNIPYQTEGQRPVIGSQQSSFAAARPQGIPSFSQGINQYGGSLDTIQGTVAPGSKILQSGPFQQQQPGTNNQQQASYNQYPENNGKIPQFPNSTPRPTDSNKFEGDSQNIYIPGSTSTSAVIPPRYSNQSYASTTPTVPTYGTAIGNIPSEAYPSNYNQGLALRPDRPQAESDRNAVILDYKNILTPNGFEYSFDTSNGIHADENGTAIDGVRAEGSYSYIGDDGKFYNVVYTADENGFQPQGDHLPTSPPIPEAIQRVIEQATREKEAGITHDGSYDDAKYGHKKYQGLRNRYHPQIQDQIITNGADIPNETETLFPEGGKKIIGYQGTRKPISTTEDIPDEYDVTNDSDRQIENAERDSANIKRPSQIPSRRPSNKIMEEDQYEAIEDGITQINRNNKPTISRTENVNQYNSDKSGSRRRRPMKQGSKDRYTNTKDEYDEFLEKSEDFENEPSLVTDKNNPSLPQKKLIESGTKYVENEYEDLPEESFATGRPKGAKRPGYSSVNNYRKESNQKLNNNNLPVLPNGSVESEDYFENYQNPGLPISARPEETMRPGPKSNTKYNESGRPRRPGISISKDDELGNTSTGVLNRRPSSEQKASGNDQQHRDVDNKYSQQYEDESGYQYIPPKNKFTQSESNIFSSRFHEKEQISSSQRPSTEYETTDKRTTAQPFMTPNVYREDDESYEDTNDQTQKEIKTSEAKTTPAPFISQTDYEQYDKELEKDQQIGDEVITPSTLRPRKPSKTVSSTRRPLYEQQTTAKPDDQYTFTGQDRVPQEGQIKPEQRIKDLKKPSQSYSPKSSTTPMPSRIFGLTKPGPYNKMTTQSQYVTTYEPETIATNKTTTAGRPESQRVSGRPSSNPISIYSEENTVPSYATSKPGTSRLPERPTSVTTTDYPYGMKLPGSTTLRPGAFSVTSRPTAADYINRTTAPGLVTIKPGGSRVTVRPDTTSRISATPKTTNAFNLPSTTYRPNYSFTDKVTQPPKPNQLGQSEQPDKSLYNVDQFGRPASQQPEKPTQSIDQFGRPQPGQPGQLSQQGKIVDQFGRTQPGQSGQLGQQKQIINKFGRPSVQPGQTAQIGQIGNTVTQLEKLQPGQVGLQIRHNQQGQTVDQFGRPQSSLPEEPGQTLNQFGRPQPGQPGRSGQPGQTGQTVDQFGRLQPAQPGQPSQSNQLGKTVDQFGRIIPSSQPGAGFIGSTTYRPEYSTPTPGSLPSTTYKDSGIPSNQFPGSFDTFKPTEPRFGGQVPGGNGVIQGQAPSYVGPYGGPTSTERVIGEDFSGPKQPQRFDPETGYHY